MNILEMSNKQYQELKAIINGRYKHTKKRIKERFGLNLKLSEYFELIGMAMDKNSVILDKNKYVEFHCLYYKNNNIIVVYEPKTQSIRTALSLEYYK